MNKIMLNNLFTTHSIKFDVNNLNKDQIHIPHNIIINKDTKFGILNLKAISSPLTKKKLEFIFMVDCSGSMSDICSDKRSKMQHIIHTLKNMIIFFKENPDLNVHVTIMTFDNNIYTIVERSLVNVDTFDKIISSIDKITPRDSTNIELALKTTMLYASELKEKYSDSNIIHIFMTDGQATTGNMSHSVLSCYIDNTISNSFIGFGMDHDAVLLNAISNNDNCSYYFIDKLENAGIVYGEILHGCVYKFIENVTITVKNGMIYNFKTNTWGETLKIGEIVSEMTKTFHIITPKPSECSIFIYGNNVIQENVIQENVLEELKESSRNINIEICGEEYEDLTKYVYRQRTQQLLYKINEFLEKDRILNNNAETLYDEKMNMENNEKMNMENNLKEEKKILKKNLYNLFKELKKFMNDNNLKYDILLKNLCDDIYICYRTFGTIFGNMFCTARMSSQGAQRAYTATHIPEDIVDEDILVRQYTLQRSNGITRNNYRKYYNDYEDEDTKILNEYEDEYNDIKILNELQHEISDSIYTPYLSPTLTKMMRSVSDGNNYDKEFI